MEILGIGMPELIFIILIVLIILGPKDMQKAGRTIGAWLNRLVTSEGWRALRATSNELRNLPNRLMREANLEELHKIGNEIGQSIEMRGEPLSPPVNPPVSPPPGPSKSAQKNRRAEQGDDA